MTFPRSFTRCLVIASPILGFAVASEATPLIQRFGNTAVTFQAGTQNHASITQTGIGNAAVVVQSGTGLQRDVTQTGNFQGYGSTQVNGKNMTGSFQAGGGNGFTATQVVIETN